MNLLHEGAIRISSLDESRLFILGLAIYKTAQVGGEIWECGAWRGGTALWMKGELGEARRTIRVFDTFAGLPNAGKQDFHRVGVMKADQAEVERLFKDLPDVSIHVGIMPATFVGLENSVISVAHIDVDQYESVRDCLSWIYPRVHPGGWIVLDDYSCPHCPGAKAATDEFLADKLEKLVIPGRPNPQAHFVKL